MTIKKLLLLSMLFALSISQDTLGRKRIYDYSIWRSKQKASNACSYCYAQKATLYMHCLTSKHLKRYYREWCRRIRLQLSLLTKYHEQCDMLINKYRQTNFLFPRKTQPYDSCDACYHNSHMLAFYCNLYGIQNKEDCTEAHRCVYKIYSIYKLYPFVPVEPLGGNHE